MIFFKRRAIASGELDFELNLISRHRDIADSAMGPDARPSPSAVRAAFWQLSGADCLARFLAKVFLVDHCESASVRLGEG
jgi:hypothetical protein